MVPCPNTSWQIEGKTTETVTHFILLGSKITEDGDCSYENKRHLLLERKALTNLANKSLHGQSPGFPSSHVQMWESDHKEGWVPRTYPFGPRCWRRLSRVPWIATRTNQLILKETNPEYSLEGLMLKLKLQYFGHLKQNADSLKKPWCWEWLRARGDGGDRGWDG